MPFWKKEKKAAAAVAGAALENGGVSNGTTTSNGSNSSAEGVGNGVGSSSNGNGGAWVKDLKVNYKARLEHKQYLVREALNYSAQLRSENSGDKICERTS